MELEEIKQTDWYKERPQHIKDAIDIKPPCYMYRMKETGKKCYIIAYDEDNDKHVTLTVQKMGEGGVLAEIGMGMLDINQVFGVELNDLEPWK